MLSLGMLCSLRCFSEVTSKYALGHWHELKGATALVMLKTWNFPFKDWKVSALGSAISVSNKRLCLGIDLKLWLFLSPFNKIPVMTGAFQQKVQIIQRLSA